MSKYLMLINIGPVQDFIATARRSRDLWFGSWFLSEISKTAARIIAECNKQNEESLIFPSADKADLKENSPFNAANKILAIVEETPEIIGAKIKAAIDARVEKIYENAFENKKSLFDFDLAKEQLADLIEFYWTAVEFEDAKYEEAREKVEYLAAARKNTRDFAKVDLRGTEGEARKSSLDGKRESVIPDNLYPNAKESLKVQTEKAARLYELFKVRDKERLCGVGLLKRLGNECDEGKVASTPHIAALPFLDSLKKKSDKGKIAAAVENYAAKLTAHAHVIEFHKVFGKLALKPHDIFGKYDAKILFENRLKEHYANEDDLNHAKNALRDFFIETDSKQSELSPYYAVLVADGDNMGKAIDAQIKKEKPIERHKSLSKALSDFAGNVKEIVNEKYGGSLIYAGGDDVLAFVPIHTVLNCAKDLADKFAEKLKSFEYEDGKSPTLSVGIAIAHFLEPLSDALELARTAEKAAKKIDGKNGLAVIVDKRSGTSREISGKFGEIYERLHQFIKLHNEGEVSHQLGYELRDLSNRLEVDQKHLDDEQKCTLSKIKKAETVRIIDRKLSKMVKNKITKNEKTEKFGAIYKLSEKENGVKLVADELITSMIFADSAKQGDKI